MTSAVHCYVDEMGEVWIGPFNGPRAPKSRRWRYLRFCDMKDGLARWSWESDRRQPDWARMPRNKFVQFLHLYGVTDHGLHDLEVAT